MIQVSDIIFLKSISLTDSSVIFNAINQNRLYLRQWLPFIDATIDENYTFAFIEDTLSRGELRYMMYHKDIFCGLIGFNNTDLANNKAEIGYWICENMQGKGIVTKSVSKLLNIAFNKLNLNKVTIKVGVSNYKSRKIPEKLNFVFEGIERDAELLVNKKYTDLAIYSLLRKEYKP